MANDASGSTWSVGGCLLWFFGGAMLSITAICSVVLLVAFLASAAVNLYMGWRLSGAEIVINRPIPGGTESVVLAPGQNQILPQSLPQDQPHVQQIQVTPIPAAVSDTTPLESQVATLAAIATQAASTPVPVSSAADAPVNVVPVPQPAHPLLVQEEPAGSGEAIEPANDSDTGNSEAPASGENAADASVRVAALTTSNNKYQLIPLEGARDERPADEHGDLNLKLRGIQKIDSPEGAKLLDLAGSTDANAPNLAAIFDPELVAEYTVKNWDWGCNCPTDWLEQVALIGVKTNPGDPVYIPPVSYDIFQGKYRAVLLYASEDAVTFAYSRDGTVAFSYAIHYIGLQTDPNLLTLFRSSRGNELPGLTLETPVGIATEELIIGVRDKGAFMDARSRKDWWR